MGWTEAAINFAFSDANGGEVVDWGNRDSVLYGTKRRKQPCTGCQKAEK